LIILTIHSDRTIILCVLVTLLLHILIKLSYSTFW